MAVTLTRPYQGNAAGAIVVFPDDVETTLIAQGFGTATTGYPVQSMGSKFPGNLQQLTSGGGISVQSPLGVVDPSAEQGARILPNTNIQAFASLGTNTTLVSGTLYRSEIFVPVTAAWTGIGVLNGVTVGTNNGLVALYDTSGNLVANSAVAGAVTAGANAFQNRAFLAPVLLMPGRYFLTYQANGATDTLRTHAAANGGNQMTSSTAGTFGTVPSTFTVPTTFTADVGPIAWLYQ
jgi:hypothetical protein